MKIVLNGKNTDTSCQNLKALIKEQNLDTASLIAELNFNIVQQAAWEKTLLNEGDTIELLSFVGGG